LSCRNQGGKKQFRIRNVTPYTEKDYFFGKVPEGCVCISSKIHPAQVEHAHTCSTPPQKG
jgi:hypothetical protein